MPLWQIYDCVTIVCLVFCLSVILYAPQEQGLPNCYIFSGPKMCQPQGNRNITQIRTQIPIFSPTDYTDLVKLINLSVSFFSLMKWE
jgi:hypothetical protein